MHKNTCQEYFGVNRIIGNSLYFQLITGYERYILKSCSQDVGEANGEIKKQVYFEMIAFCSLLIQVRIGFIKIWV